MLLHVEGRSPVVEYSECKYIAAKEPPRPPKIACGFSTGQPRCARRDKGTALQCFDTVQSKDFPVHVISQPASRLSLAMPPIFSGVLLTMTSWYVVGKSIGTDEAFRWPSSVRKRLMKVKKTIQRRDPAEKVWTWRPI